MVELLGWQVWVNGVAISLEIIGFIIMLKSSKKLKLKVGEFNADRYVDPATDELPATVTGPPDPKRYRTGIGFVIAGLAGQIIAMFL